jgi:hypothetical protein
MSNDIPENLDEQRKYIDDFLLYMSKKGEINLNEKSKKTISEYIQQEEKKLKERNYLRQFNTNFEDYKSVINKKMYERDQNEIERLNDIQQPQFLYNNFPLILGIIFLIFGIIFILSNDTKDNDINDIKDIKEVPNIIKVVRSKK